METINKDRKGPFQMTFVSFRADSLRKIQRKGHLPLNLCLTTIY